MEPEDQPCSVVERYLVIRVCPRWKFLSKLVGALVSGVQAYVYDSRKYAEQHFECARRDRQIVYTQSFSDSLPAVIRWGEQQMKKLEALDDEVNRVVVFMRREYAEEMASGQYPHSPGASFADMVIHYLLRERILSRKKKWSSSLDQKGGHQGG